MKQYEAYPNLGKLFQVIATASGVRPHVKKAGRYTRDKDLSQRKINDPKKAEEIISELFIQPLKKTLDPEIARLFGQWLTFYSKEYIRISSKISLEGLSPKQATELLAKHFFSEAISGWLEQTSALCSPGVIPEFFFAEYPVAKLISIFENQFGLTAFDKYVSKKYGAEQTRKIYNWKSGDIPSLESLSLIAEWTASDSDGLLLEDKLAFFTARFIAKLNEILGVEFHPMVFLWLEKRMSGDKTPYDVGLALSSEYQELIKPLNKILAKEGLLLQERLKRNRPKNGEERERLRIDLLAYQKQLADYCADVSLSYYIQWLQARYHVYVGEYFEAANRYFLAVESAMYNAGENNKLIIREALALAAITNSSKSKFEKLKARAIQCAPELIDASGQYLNHKTSREEMNAWKCEFCLLFPSHGWFSDSVEKHRAFYEAQNVDTTTHPYKFLRI